MIQRIFTLFRYHLKDFLFSLPGLIYVLGAFAYYQVLFAPGHRTPDIDYLIFVLGIFGGGFTFLITLSITTRANSANSYIFFARLPSRIEYLAGILLTSVAFASMMQLILASLVITFGKSELTLTQATPIPPIWWAVNIFAGILALHASDFSSNGWSRTYLFGGILFFLFAQGNGFNISSWLANRFLSLSTWAYQQQFVVIGDLSQKGADWLFTTGTAWFAQFVTLLFWPFRALTDAIMAGSFTPRQALAPAILLIYATLLFFFASDLLARKDLFLTE